VAYVEDPAALDYPEWLDYYGLDDTQESYDAWLAGLDPDDPFDVFYASIKVENGVPFVWWHPDLGDELRKYTIMGKVNLTDPGPWIDIPPKDMPTTPARFFKVRVGLPAK